jgi:hypothetical protein
MFISAANSGRKCDPAHVLFFKADVFSNHPYLEFQVKLKKGEA